MKSTASAMFIGPFKALGIAIALSVATLALTACGSADEPASATAPAATAVSDSTPDGTGAPAPSAMLAPTFELPSAQGENVSLASFTGDKNVVLVFYRGFW